MLRSTRRIMLLQALFSLSILVWQMIPSTEAFPVAPNNARAGFDKTPSAWINQQFSMPSPTTTTKSTPRNKSRMEMMPLAFFDGGGNVSEWPQLAQAGVFLTIYAGLGVGTMAGTRVLDGISQSMGLERWRNSVVDTALPTVLGAFYVLAGLGHFLNSQGFCQIYPPVGTWGIWYIPGSAMFHVTWTGIVELFGGAGLLWAGVLKNNNDDDDDNLLSNLVLPVSALVLFVLTLLVTPANIYMFTHGATMETSTTTGQPLDVQFHVIRFGVQVLLLSMLLTLSKDAFFFAWGEELD